MICTVEGCEKPLAAQGLCHMHRNRVRRSGTTDARPHPQREIKPYVCGTQRAYQTGGCRCEVCKQGMRDRAKAYHGRYKATIAAKRLVKEYGITQAEYDRMLAEQGGVCLICRGVRPDAKPLYVDHCHTTGKVRGLLCTQCNTGIGMLGDSPDRLMAAAAYLLQQADVLTAVSIGDDKESA